MSITTLPIPGGLHAKDLLAAASRRDFDAVVILGTYRDGELRHASTMTAERELWLLELRKQQLLGIVETAFVPKEGSND